MAGEFLGELIEKGLIPAVVSLVIGLFTVCASIAISYYTSHQTRAVAEDQRDADMLNRFAEFHFGDEPHRRFSVWIVERMNNPGWRRGLRQFIIAETMRRHFNDTMPVAPFDRNDLDWALVGDAAYNLQRDWGNAEPEPSKTFDEWWCKKKDEYTDRWPKHKQTIHDLFKHLDESDFRLHGVTLKPCEPAKI
jgi:hypothetical protein